MKNYKWVILLALTAIYAASNGYGYLSIPVFYPSLTDYFGVQKGIVPQTASIMTLIIAFLSPLAGFLLDKFKPRVILTIGVLGIVAMQFYFTKIETLNDLKIFNIGYAVVLCLGGFISNIFILNGWFQKNRGIALGIFLNASSLGAALFSPYIGNLLKTNSWQDSATQVLTITAILLILPLFFIKSNKNQVQTETTTGINLEEAIKTPTFWFLMLATAAIWFCMNGIIFHKDSYLSDLNLDSSQRGKFGSLFFFSGVVGKLLFGFLSDKFDKKNTMLFAISFIITANILLKLSQTNQILIPYIAIIYGIGYSGSFTMIQLLIADFYFGKYYGRILGFFLLADMLAGTLSVFLLGNWRNVSNNYDSSFVVLIGVSIVAFLGMVVVKKCKNVEAR